MSGCEDIRSCSKCNDLWPSCAWCASNGKCHSTPTELSRMHEGVTRLHVLYNIEEYETTYGKSQTLREYESVSGNQCLVWIVNATSCGWVGNYCTHAASCSSCLQRSGGGCGWCHGQSRCMAGTQSSEMRMTVDEPECKEASGGMWIFGNWAKYMDYGVWENKCMNLPEIQTGNYVQDINTGDGYSSSSNSAPRGHDMPSSIIPIAIAGIFSVIIITLFFLVKFRRTIFLHGPPPDAQEMSQDWVSFGRGVDIQALEKESPQCKPIVIGKEQIDRAKRKKVSEHADNEDNEKADDETKTEVSTDSAVPCSVCLCHMEIGEEARFLPCDHLFHKQCIDSWLEKSLQCPVCRRQVMNVGKMPIVVGRLGQAQDDPTSADDPEMPAEPSTQAIPGLPGLQASAGSPGSSQEEPHGQEEPPSVAADVQAEQQADGSPPTPTSPVCPQFEVITYRNY